MNSLDREINDYVDDYNEKIANEILERKKLRKEKLMHQRNITRCNILLVAEGIVLVTMVIALIVNCY